MNGTSRVVRVIPLIVSLFFLEGIRAILEDRSARPEAQGGIAPCSSGRGNCPSLQIKADRYYAAHLFGDLKDARRSHSGSTA